MSNAGDAPVTSVADQTGPDGELLGLAATVTQAGIAETAELIAPYVRRTPVITVDRAEFGLPPGELVLKLEQLQHSGSFKVRGAFTNLLRREIPAAGVVAASGGNHGAAVAYAAGVLGIPARIFVPEVSSEAKTSRIRSYGADLVVSGAAYTEALALSQEWAAESGAMPVHAYDQAETMLGAGTAGAELCQQDGAFTTVLTGAGGGGLLAGTAAACAGRARVVGAEPEDAPTLTYAMKAGQPVDAPVGSVAVDSLAPRQVGVLSLAVISRYADGVVLVSDDAIRAAQRLLWDKLRVVGEPGGCAALAALLSGRYVPQPGERVAVVISGANTTAVDFSH
ncbi:MAG: threonine/serine dehydratase [Actinomycetota bacterium]